MEAEYWTGSSRSSAVGRRAKGSGEFAWGKDEQITNISEYRVAEKENYDPNVKDYEAGQLAKLQIAREMKLFKLFNTWKLNCLALNYDLQIQKEAEL